MTKPDSSKMTMLVAGVCIGAAPGALFAVLDLMARGGRLTSVEATELLVLCVGAASALSAIACPILLWFKRRVLRSIDDEIAISGMFGLALQIVFILHMSGLKLALFSTVPWVLAYLLCFYARKKGLAGSVTFVFFASTGAGVGYAALSGLMPKGMIGSFLILGLICLAGGLTAWLARLRVVFAIGLLFLIAVAEFFVVGMSPRWDLVPSSASATSNQPSDSPNVVLIVLDTTRRDHMGCYGDQRGLTPNIDALAKEGVVYEDMISTSSWTLPSHASMFSGYYPVTHGCGNEHHRWLDGGFVTLAELLAADGFQTVSVTNNHYLEPSNLLQGFQYKINPWSRRSSLKSSKWMMAAGLPEGWSDHGVVDSVSAVSNWLERDRDTSRPFFLFVNLMEAHWPHFPPMSHRSKWLPDGVGYLSATRTSSQFYGVLWMAGKPYSSQEEETIKGLYAASVAYQDAKLGAMLDAISSQVDLDNTLVLVTADHGENLGEGGRWDHVFSLTDALIRVPMIVRYPGKFPAGQRLDGGCQLVDILPTIFDVLGRPVPLEGQQGRSLVPGGFEPRESTFAQTSPYYGHLERMEAVTGFHQDVMSYTAHLRAIRTDQFKFIWSSRGDHRLYDLAADPKELTNVFEALPEIGARFEQQAVQWWSSQAPYVPRPGDDASAIQKDSLESLRSLGYVGD